MTVPLGVLVGAIVLLQVATVAVVGRLLGVM